MHTRTSTRLLAASMALTLCGGATTAAAAQNEGGGNEGADNEFGIGLYLGNCDSLVAGAALYDLGDAELETEDFGNADENADENAQEGTDLEGELEDESAGDETDVEGALEGGQDENTGDNSDEEVVTPADALAVYVASGATFGANLVELVDAPFAVAARRGADDSADGAEDEYVSCGEFGGAVAGNEIVIPLEGLGDGGLNGIAILERGEGDGESAASVYLFGGPIEDVVEAGEGTPEGTPEA
ncbi:MAG: hypothetical protein AVDCRST_MAG19-2950 [uncultured Thermomicrobiales bacterium]|uniref:Uncharacterized protein n=1 Tax=uncultured Thermomicrobiales bacterium TaxID=1645740 RepID=A0A6J4V9Y7_9BACT|nr:MAG: hypothetical protein AVDCRST_MAG19-2950 [uncultured Thermomicrobiales bacterium]